MGNKDYARIRSLCSALPPTSHVKSYEESLAPSIPQVYQAPNHQEGGFCDLTTERNTQIEHLDAMGLINENKVIYVKAGLDGTRLSHQNSAAVYSLTTITEDGWDIGAVGLVMGGDHYGNMKNTAKPYFDGVKSIAMNSEVTVGERKLKTQVVIGGSDIQKIKNMVRLYLRLKFPEK